jgi:Cu2+-exporting ATPase
MRNEAELVGVQTGESGGAITLTYWWFAGDRAHALTRTTTVLIIACPHALGLAIPLVIAISTSLGGQNGLLVKDRLALEGARDLDVVVFDKTGTLYARRSSVVQRGGCVRVREDDLFSRAAAVENDSEHPLAKVIVAEAKRRGLPSLPRVTSRLCPAAVRRLS